MGPYGRPFMSVENAKTLARRLRGDLAAAGVEISHSLALELVAHQQGAKDWNVLAAGGSARVAAGPSVPVLRVMSMEVALPFYVGFLGFTLDWEHRFDVGMPVYAQVSWASATVHLSEHHGDGSPHGVVWIPVADVNELHQRLHAQADQPLRPGIDVDAPGGPTLEVIDPYGNVLRFAETL
ncbi:glyoxalase superfamily protein [Kribbella lupini]|uniref:Bleomycin resistance protein n=2 Tax=Kribbella lupini TaxID=291602 RepID=A0ABP4LJ30_9ACTN